MKLSPVTHHLQSGFLLPLHSQGAVGRLLCWELDSGSCLAGAGSTARHAMSWEGATYPTSAGLSAALLASQRSTTALDGTVTSWVCRGGEKKGIINIGNTPGISPHPTATSVCSYGTAPECWQNTRTRGLQKVLNLPATTTTSLVLLRAVSMQCCSSTNSGSY